MDLHWQSNVSALKYAVYLCHNFHSKEQASFNLMAAVTVSSDFGAQENTVSYCFHCRLSQFLVCDCGLTTLIV